jgi:hypothetical protein
MQYATSFNALHLILAQMGVPPSPPVPADQRASVALPLVAAAPA